MAEYDLYFNPTSLESYIISGMAQMELFMQVKDLKVYQNYKNDEIYTSYKPFYGKSF